MPLDTASIVQNAAYKGHVQVLRWLQSTDPNAHMHFKSRALADAIQGGHLEVVKFLYEECKTAFGHVEHLVLDRGFWSRAALAASCQRNPSVRLHTGPGESKPPPDAGRALATSRFIYTQAQERARYLQTTLDEQLDFSRIAIGYVWGRELAMWLLQNVTEASVWRGPNPSIYNGVLNFSATQQVLPAYIKYRSDECRAVSWLPQWAVRVNGLEELQIVDASGHPNVRDLETFEAIIQHTRDARLMLKLLPLPVDSPPSLRKNIVQWAAQFGMVTVLDRVFDDEEPKTPEKLLKHVVGQAGFSGHVETVQWLLARCSLLGISNTSVVKGIQTDALRHGYTASLTSLYKRQLLRETSGAMHLMVSEAAQARQVRSLEWLLENLTITVKLIAKTLIDAVRQCHTEIVAFITGEYDPRELHLLARFRRSLLAWSLSKRVEKDRARCSAPPRPGPRRP